MTTLSPKANAQLAYGAVILCADWMDTKDRTKAQDVAKAKFMGHCYAANAIGYGMTPTEVFMTAMDWVKANPRPNGGSAMAVEYKGWANRARTEFSAIFATLA